MISKVVSISKEVILAWEEFLILHLFKHIRDMTLNVCNAAVCTMHIT